MTVEELLEIAQAHVRFAAFGTKPERHAIDAAIALACAQTAQAMILAQTTSSGTDYNGTPMLVFRTEQLR